MENRRKLELFFAASLLAVFPAALAAQTTSSTDGVPSPAVEPGNPASSHALSGIDHVNEYNGKLNVTIPLYHVGGRGTAGYTMILPVEASWDVEQDDPTRSYFPGYDGSDGSASTALPYSPGILWISADNAEPYACYDPNTNRFYDLGPYVARVYWDAPDGTETVLLDTAYGGQPLDPPAGNGSDCGNFLTKQLADRGKIFRSTDGSDLTFVADQDIYDTNELNGGITSSGTLYFRDGTRYHVNMQGEVDLIEDRNGNQVTLTYGYDSSGRYTLTVVDPLDRTINVVIGYPTSYGQPRTADTITYPGADGARTITINHSACKMCFFPGRRQKRFSVYFLS